jgi:PAS domain S-box-containing protein/diguanylate cyclase (GGDEF)-like protein
MFGYKSKDELIDLNPSDFYKDPSQRKVYNNKLKSQGYIKNEEMIYLRKDGRPFIGSDTAIAVKDSNGKLLYYDGIIDDITERVALRKKLIENEEKYRSLVSSSPDVILRVSKDGIVNYINYAFNNDKPRDIIGKSIYELMPSEFHDKAKKAINTVFKTGERQSYEHIGVGSKEEVKWYRNNVGPIESNGQIVGSTVIARDITEEKQIDVLKSEFISSVSHELRTPLAIIQESIAQVLEGLHGEIKEIQKDILSPCLDDIERLTRIINNLLDISKIEGQKVTISREMVDIVGLAKNVLHSFEMKAQNKDIELKFKSSVKKAEIFIDHDRIIQVFMNLLGNAIKFTDKGLIELSIRKFENHIQCTVADTGIGIQHNDLAKVFDRFHQVGKVVSSREKGSGLGLSISRGIIELHNGKISVKSEFGKGSQFKFILPIYSEDEILLENIEKNITVATKKHIKLSLLIIRLDNYHEIKKKKGQKLAQETTHKVLETLQEIIAPGDFSFIKGNNEVILFSDITEKDILGIVDTIEEIINKFIAEFSKKIKIKISFGYSVYPNDGENAKEILRVAYKTLFNN